MLGVSLLAVLLGLVSVFGSVIAGIYLMVRLNRRSG